MICISLNYLSLHNFLNKMLFIVCNFLLSGNYEKKMRLQEFVGEVRENGDQTRIKEELKDHA